MSLIRKEKRVFKQPTKAPISKDVKSEILDIDINQIRRNTETKKTLEARDEKDKERLRKFLIRFLRKAVPNEFLQEVLSPDNMKIWLSAFTHETYGIGVMDYEIDDYEEFEYHGDKRLGAIFADYLRKNYPELKKDQLSQLGMHYMSKQAGGQTDMAQNAGLEDYIRVGKDITGHQPEINLDMIGDVFESLFGALYVIGETISRAYGELFTSKLLEKILESSPIELDKAYQNAKTILAQNFTYKAKELPIKNNDGSITKKIYLDVRNKELFEIARMPLLVRYFETEAPVTVTDYKEGRPSEYTGILIGEATAFRSEEASRAANINAINLFRSMGVEYKELNNLKRIRDINHPAIYQLWNRANAIANRKYKIDLAHFKAGAKLNTKEGKSLILYAKKQSDKSDTPKYFGIASLYTGNDNDKGNIGSKVKLLNLYIALNSD